jgi:hypothetical protein
MGMTARRILSDFFVRKHSVIAFTNNLNLT